jgi:hypothetical protein
MPVVTTTYDPDLTTGASSTDVVIADAAFSMSTIPRMDDLTLIPGGWLPPEQEYYWTEEWQSAEREARDDIASGRGVRFETAEDVIHWLMSSDED